MFAGTFLGKLAVTLEDILVFYTQSSLGDTATNSSRSEQRAHPAHPNMFWIINSVRTLGTVVDLLFLLLISEVSHSDDQDALG